MARCTPCWFGLDWDWRECINNCLGKDCDCYCRDKIIKVDDDGQ